LIENNSIVKLEAVEKIYQRGSEEIHALKEVYFSLPQGAFVSILGPSGSGKTTLLNIIGCLDRPSMGTVKIDGEDIGGLDEKALVRIRREKIGFVFQQFYLLPGLSVRENIALPLIFSKKKVSDKYLEDIIDVVGLAGRSKHKPSQLSGGEMQRVAIARALVNEPSIILADEPTGNLDLRNREIILELFSSLNQQGFTIIVVTHEIKVAEKTGTAFAMSDGTLSAVNDIADYFCNLAVSKLR
jgi:putative ABC transport system ATP-binding protein